VAFNYRLRKLTAGLYFKPPFAYSIFTAESLERRIQFRASHPTVRWVRQAVAKPKLEKLEAAADRDTKR
jgi:hypothetical protein